MTTESDDSTIIDDEPSLVRNSDVIRIETAHHLYKFAVTDSYNKRGLLRGGTFGEGGLTARSGSLIEQGYGARFDVWFAGAGRHLGYHGSGLHQRRSKPRPARNKISLL